MKRINYLLTRSEQLTGIPLRDLIPFSLRGPVLALSGALVLVGVLHGLQSARLGAATRDGNAIVTRTALVERQLDGVRSLERETLALRQLATTVSALQHSGAARASELAAIGNRLPNDAWLTSIRVERGGYALDGHCVRLASVGTTMAALALRGTARLIGVREDPTRHGVTYSLAVDGKP